MILWRLTVVLMIVSGFSTLISFVFAVVLFIRKELDRSALIVFLISLAVFVFTFAGFAVFLIGSQS